MVIEELSGPSHELDKRVDMDSWPPKSYTKRAAFPKSASRIRWPEASKRRSRIGRVNTTAVRSSIPLTHELGITGEQDEMNSANLTPNPTNPNSEKSISNIHHLGIRSIRHRSTRSAPQEKATMVMADDNVQYTESDVVQLTDLIKPTSLNETENPERSSAPISERKGRIRSSSYLSLCDSCGITSWLPKWILITSAAALWAYLAYVYFICRNQPRCIELKNLTRAVLEIPDVPQIVLGFTFLAGTALIILSIIKFLFGGSSRSRRSPHDDTKQQTR
ncbi:unnamed protein product [Notodromas monacha]|uniref:Uncharacterized protein n=1 Tax=Notodromas monacha TaxID=399045 RepID=A0A7R9BPU8_9CRUS|nr:unnamed protein product [Notodromas monacha]CAG0918377.1 unnamed protein product [Notodromas monacha]